jgi:hypothetical protein
MRFLAEPDCRYNCDHPETCPLAHDGCEHCAAVRWEYGEWGGPAPVALTVLTGAFAALLAILILAGVIAILSRPAPL